MQVVSTSQIQTGLKEVVRRSDGAVTRGELIKTGTLEIVIEGEHRGAVMLTEGP